MTGRTAPSTLRAALFDVDGTLVDSNDLHAEAWAEAFSHFGFDIPAARIRFQIGKGGDNLIPNFLPDLAESARKEIEDFRSDLYKRDYLPRVRPFPGVRPLFERIRADDVAIVLASSSGKEEVDHHVEMLGIGDLIAGATSKDDAGRSKPCPDIFEAALEKAEASAEEAIVVGDSPWDVKAAARLGLPTLALRCGGFPDDALREAGATWLFDGAEDLLGRYEDSPFGHNG